MPHPKVKISDDSGNTAYLTGNALDVNIASGTADIDIGDVSLLLDGTAADYGTGNVNTTGRTLRVTLASDDLHFGPIEAAADVDGNIHGQLRFIGNSVSTSATELGTIDTSCNNIETYTGNSATLLGTIDTDTGSLVNYLNLIVKGTSQQYSEGNYGIPALAVRNDAPLASLTTDDNDFAPLQVNASGALYVDIADGGQLDALLDTIKVDTEAIETAVEILDNAISGSEMQVDVVAALPAGTNAIGKLAANSGVDIGDVDVTSISAGTNIIGKVGHDITGMVSDLDADVGTTAEKIHTAADVAIKRIDIQAHPDNTGYIFVGDNGVAGNGSGGGIRLSAGDFYSLDIDNTGDVYVAASVADEDVTYIYYT